MALAVPSRKLVWGLLVLAGMILLASMVYRVGFRRRSAEKGDTRFYYRAAERFVAGRNLYRWEEDEPTTPGGVTGYIYLPPFAALCTWMAALPYPAVRVVWLLLMAACMLASGRWALRQTDPGPACAHDQSRPWVAVVLAICLGRFVINDFAHGQVNALTCWLVLAGLWQARQGHDRGAGILLACANLIKPTFGPLVLWFLLVDRRPRLLGWFAGVFGLALLLPGLRYGAAYAAMLLDWFEALRAFSVWAGAQLDNASLAGMFLRWLSGSSPTGDFAVSYTPVLWALDPDRVRVWARLASVLVVAAVFAFLALRRRKAAHTPGALLVLCVLLSPVTWKAHLVVLMLPVACLGSALVRRRRRRDWIFLAGLICLFMLPARGLPGLSWWAAAGGLTVPLLLLLGWCMLPEEPVSGVVARAHGPAGSSTNPEERSCVGGS